MIFKSSKTITKKWIVTVTTARKNNILFLLGGLTKESDNET
jgi:hypothetical protein